jgi:CelD/BcsL family acetyltransferase involved in cellulose biosynthesis
LAIDIVAVDSLQRIDAQQWDDLWASCPDSTVFQTRQWLQAVTDTILESAQQLKIILAMEDGRLIGMAPLVRATLRDARAGRANWLILGDDYSDYQPFLAWGGSLRIIEALVAGIDDALPPGQAVALHDVPQFSSLGLYFADGAVRGKWLVHGDPVACPTLRVRHNMAGVARVLSKSSLRRSERSLSRLGQISIEHLRDTAAITPLLEGLFAQHIERWSAMGTGSLFANPKNRLFYYRLANTLAPSGGLQFTIVRVNGRAVAHHFGLRSRDSLLWYKPAFDIGLAKHSPGDLLVRALVQYAASHDLDELDFTRGDESFKSRFASSVGFNRSYLWYRRRRSRWMAKFKQGCRGARDMLNRPVSTVEVPLGGAPVRGGMRNLAVLVNARPQTVLSWRRLGCHGVEIRAVSQSALAEYVANEQGALIVPCDEISVRFISALPQDHSLRSTTLLPPEPLASAAFEGAIAGLRPGSEMWATGPECGVDSFVLCLYMHGRMIAHHVSVAKRGSCTGAAVQYAKSVLDSVRWHGPATVRFRRAEDGVMVLGPVVPWFDDCLDQAVRSGVNFPLAMWRIANGFCPAPQPLPARS